MSSEITRLTVTIPEVCTILGLSRNTTYELLRSGALPARKLGGKWIISRKAVEALVDSPASEAA